MRPTHLNTHFGADGTPATGKGRNLPRHSTLNDNARILLSRRNSETESQALLLITRPDLSATASKFAADCTSFIAERLIGPAPMLCGSAEGILLAKNQVCRTTCAAVGRSELF